MSAVIAYTATMPARSPSRRERLMGCLSSDTHAWSQNLDCARERRLCMVPSPRMSVRRDEMTKATVDRHRLRGLTAPRDDANAP
jgi:hypothetical protein